MNKDETRIALAAGAAGFKRVVFYNKDVVCFQARPDQILEFARKIAEHEREACAKICDEQAQEPECPERARYCAEAIRERNNHRNDDK